MDPIAGLLRFVILPGAICFGAALLARWACRRDDRVERPRLHGSILAIGLAAGFCAALWALEVRPSLPLEPFEDAWRWVFWFAVAGALLGVAVSAGPRSRPLRFLLEAAIATVLCWPMLRMIESIPAGEAVLRAAVAGGAAAVLWTAIDVRAARWDWASAAIPLAAALVSAASTMLRNGRSIEMSIATGALAASVLATAALSRFRGGAAIPAAAAPVVALAFAGLLLGAHSLLNFGGVVGFPLATALLLAASAASVALPGRRLAVVASIALAVAAAIVAEQLATTSNQWGE